MSPGWILNFPKLRSPTAKTINAIPIRTILQICKQKKSLTYVKLFREVSTKIRTKRFLSLPASFSVIFCCKGQNINWSFTTVTSDDSKRLSRNVGISVISAVSVTWVFEKMTTVSCIILSLSSIWSRNCSDGSRAFKGQHSFGHVLVRFVLLAVCCC